MSDEVYEYEDVSYTEEGLQSSAVPGRSMNGWRRFRISYHEKDSGFSNLEGTLYFPPGIDPYPILDKICEELSKGIKRA